jgi:hypothetical protein
LAFGAGRRSYRDCGLHVYEEHRVAETMERDRLRYGRLSMETWSYRLSVKLARRPDRPAGSAGFAGRGGKNRRDAVSRKPVGFWNQTGF